MVEWLAGVDGDEFDAHVEVFFISLRGIRRIGIRLEPTLIVLG